MNNMANKKGTKEDSKFDLLQFRILYGLSLISLYIDIFIETVLNYTFLSIAKLILSKSKWITFNNRLCQHKNEQMNYLYKPLDALDRSFATRTIGWCIFGYLSPILFMFWGVTTVLTDNINIGMVVYVIITIVIFYLTPNYDKYSKKRRYLKYINKFNPIGNNKKSQYIWLAFLYCLGSLVTFFLGLRLCFLIIGMFHKNFGATGGL